MELIMRLQCNTSFNFVPSLSSGSLALEVTAPRGLFDSSQNNGIPLLFTVSVPKSQFARNSGIQTGVDHANNTQQAQQEVDLADQALTSGRVLQASSTSTPPLSPLEEVVKSLRLSRNLERIKASENYKEYFSLFLATIRDYLPLTNEELQPFYDKAISKLLEKEGKEESVKNKTDSSVPWKAVVEETYDLVYSSVLAVCLFPLTPHEGEIFDFSLILKGQIPLTQEGSDLFWMNMAIQGIVGLESFIRHFIFLSYVNVSKMKREKKIEAKRKRLEKSELRPLDDIERLILLNEVPFDVVNDFIIPLRNLYESVSASDDVKDSIHELRKSLRTRETSWTSTQREKTSLGEVLARWYYFHTFKTDEACYEQLRSIVKPLLESIENYEAGRVPISYLTRWYMTCIQGFFCLALIFIPYGNLSESDRWYTFPMVCKIVLDISCGIIINFLSKRLWDHLKMSES